MIRLALALVAFAAPALAQVDGWPALYDVTGVDPGASLNIRAKPTTRSKIVGALAGGAKGVEVIRADNQGWGLVNTSESNGWVSLKYLARKAGQWDSDFPTFTSCSGTEPFWSLTHQAGELTLARPEQPNVSALIDWQQAAANGRHSYSFRAGDLLGLLARKTCNDGMSDREMGLEINLILLEKGMQYQGCCSIAPPAE